MQWGWDDPPLNKPPRVKMRLDQEGTGTGGRTKLRVRGGWKRRENRIEWLLGFVAIDVLCHDIAFPHWIEFYRLLFHRRN
jgi:hypothetical protein